MWLEDQNGGLRAVPGQAEAGAWVELHPPSRARGEPAWSSGPCSSAQPLPRVLWLLFVIWRAPLLERVGSQYIVRGWDFKRGSHLWVVWFRSLETQIL